MFKSHSSLRKVILVFLVAFIALNSVSYALAAGKKQLSNSHATLTDISFAPSDITAGWAVGQNGRDSVVLKQNSGGAWNETKTFKNKTLNSIVMVSASLGYAVGNGGFIIAYDGSEWKTQSSGTNRNLRRVQLGPNGLVFAVGDSGTAVVTFAGGGGLGSGQPNDEGGWLVLPTASGNPNFTGGVVFSDGGLGYNGYLVASGGQMRKWTSATWSWSTITTGVTDDLSDISMSSATAGYITAANGKVWEFNGINLTYLTQLSITGQGVVDLRSGTRANSGNPGPKASGSNSAELTDADAVVVGNDALGTGSVGILRRGGWSTDGLVENSRLNYLTLDNGGNVWTVGNDAAIVVVQ